MPDVKQPGPGTVPKTTVLTLAADFHNARVDVFDESFELVTAPAFTNPKLPIFRPSALPWPGGVKPGCTSKSMCTDPAGAFPRFQRTVSNAG